MKQNKCMNLTRHLAVNKTRHDKTKYTDKPSGSLPFQQYFY